MATTKKRKYVRKTTAKPPEPVVEEQTFEAPEPDPETPQQKMQREVREKMELESQFLPVKGLSGYVQALDFKKLDIDYTLGGILHPRWVSKDERILQRRIQEDGYRFPQDVHPDLPNRDYGDLTLMVCNIETANRKRAELRAKTARLAESPKRDVHKDDKFVDIQFGKN